MNLMTDQFDLKLFERLGIRHASGSKPNLTNGLQINGAEVTATAAQLNAAAANSATVVQAGQHSVDSDEDTAGELDIVTGLAAVAMFQVQILRAGAVVTGDAAVSESEGTLTVADGGDDYAVTENDVVQWLAVGTV